MTERELIILKRALPADVWGELNAENKKQNLGKRQEQSQSTVTIDSKKIREELKKEILKVFKEIGFN